MSNAQLLQSVKNVILQARQQAYRMVNAALLQTYWEIGKIIVGNEQNGNDKAEHGKATLKKLANKLTLEFGKGFNDSNLRNMRSLYRAFPIRDTLRHELSWSHYRQLSRLEHADKREFYLTESIAAG